MSNKSGFEVDDYEDMVYEIWLVKRRGQTCEEVFTEHYFIGHRVFNDKWKARMSGKDCCIVINPSSREKLKPLLTAAALAALNIKEAEKKI